jgi:hypothetical protein
MAHHLIMLCLSWRDPTVYSYPFIRASRTLPSSPSSPRHCCLRRHYRCRHISCCHCSHRPYHHPCRRLPFGQDSTPQTHTTHTFICRCRRCLRRSRPLPSSPSSPWHCCLRCHHEPIQSNGLLVHLLLRHQIKVTMRTMMLPMLWRDCLGWLPSEGSLQTLLRGGMESKGVLTRMTMNMDGENI